MANDSDLLSCPNVLCRDFYTGHVMLYKKLFVWNQHSVKDSITDLIHTQRKLAGVSVPDTKNIEKMSDLFQDGEVYFLRNRKTVFTIRVNSKR